MMPYRDPQDRTIEFDLGDGALSNIVDLINAVSETSAIRSLCAAARRHAGARAVGLLLNDGQYCSIDENTSGLRDHSGERQVLPIPAGRTASGDEDGSFVTIPFEAADVAGVRFRWEAAATKTSTRTLYDLSRIAERSIATIRERRKLLARIDDLTLAGDEARHRLKNAYASAAGLASLSLPREVAIDVRNRIMSLMSVYDGMDNGSPTLGPVDLGTHIATLLQPYQRGPDTPVRLSGSALPIADGLRRPLALVINELATNASKYGALSVPDGRIEVSWNISDGMLSLDWCESGIPISADRCEPGDGSRIMENVVRRHLGGEMSRQPSAGGLHTGLRFPLTP